LLTGIIGVGAASVPTLVALEDSLGLQVLHRIRGPRASPAGVVVVSMDETTAAKMGLPGRVRDWPRTLHGRLVDTLARQGATTIAFDVEFFSSRPEAVEDRL
jgi:adenylate cyclase